MNLLILYFTRYIQCFVTYFHIERMVKNMASICLSIDQFSTLAEILNRMETINGTDVYQSKPVCSYDCDHWDCFISCHCANSRD